jgi:hypothetical protein
MPLNILITFIAGSALGWLLIKTTKAPNHLRGLILGCCAAGGFHYFWLKEDTCTAFECSFLIYKFSKNIC